jgi:lipoate-protein ligase A
VITPSPSLHWKALHSAPAERQWIDASIDAGFAEPQLALVHYDEPALIYGRRGGDDPARRARAEREGIEVLHRRSGGGVVLAGPWLAGFHALLPSTHAVARLGVIGSMVWLGKTVSTALYLSRVANALADANAIDAVRVRARASSLDWACYASLSHGELVDKDGAKLLGLSQARGRFGVLVSGGLLVSQSPWETLEYVHDGERREHSALRDLASAGVGVVAPSADLPNLYARLATCLAIALDPDVVDGSARDTEVPLPHADATRFAGDACATAGTPI